jgi:hypothetical protein
LQGRIAGSFAFNGAGRRLDAASVPERPVPRHHSPDALIETARTPATAASGCIQEGQEGAMPQPKRPKAKPAPSRTTRTHETSPAGAPVTFLECIPRYLAADLTQRAAIEKKTIVQVVEEALRAYLGTPGPAPRKTPPQVSGEISFGNLGGPTVPEWGGGVKRGRKS